MRLASPVASTPVKEPPAMGATAGKHAGLLRPTVTPHVGSGATSAVSPASDLNLQSYGDQILVLYTPMTRDQLATVTTRRLMTHLEGLSIPHVRLDGTDPSNKAVRSSLWVAAKAQAGAYPVLYIGSSGEAFHGDEVQALIDTGELVNKLRVRGGLAEEALISAESPVAPSEPPELPEEPPKEPSEPSEPPGAAPATVEDEAPRPGKATGKAPGRAPKPRKISNLRRGISRLGSKISPSKHRSA